MPPSSIAAGFLQAVAALRRNADAAAAAPGQLGMPAAEQQLEQQQLSLAAQQELAPEARQPPTPNTLPRLHPDRRPTHASCTSCATPPHSRRRR